MVAPEGIAEDVEVTRLEVPFVLLNLAEVRVNTPLADFVGHDRVRTFGHPVGIVVVRLRLRRVELAFEPIAPHVQSRPHEYLILFLRDIWPARSPSVQPSPIGRLPLVHKPAEKLLLLRPAWFIADAQANEGRMIAVSVHYSLGLGVDEGIRRWVITQRAPDGRFDVQIDARFVGGDECGFRGTVRVKSQVVEPVCLEHPADLRPRLHIRGRISGLGENTAFERAPQHDRPAVDGDLCAPGCNLAQGEGRHMPVEHGPIRGGTVQLDFRSHHRGIELIPQRSSGNFYGHPLRGSRPGRFKPQRHKFPVPCTGPDDLPPKKACHGFASHIADDNLKLNSALSHVRDCGHGLDPHRIRRSQFDPADDPVPVGLRMFGEAVGVLANLVAVGVVHPHDQAAPAGFDESQVIFVRRHQAVAHANMSAIQPHITLPVDPLHEQAHPFPPPSLGHLNLDGVPGVSFVAKLPRQVVLFKLRDALTITRLIGGPWQVDEVRQFLLKPFLGLPDAIGVHAEFPSSSQRNGRGSPTPS